MAREAVFKGIDEMFVAAALTAVFVAIDHRK